MDPILKITLGLTLWLFQAASPWNVTAHAGEHGRISPAAWPAAYVQECGTCHVAYPPDMLTAPSWARLMAGLNRHFGTDASLDPQDAQRIGQWLVEHADSRRKNTTQAGDDRITRTAWFVRKHRDIEANTWQLPSVRAASNCMACHTSADRGEFSERALRRPAGLSARQRSAWAD